MSGLFFDADLTGMVVVTGTTTLTSNDFGTNLTGNAVDFAFDGPTIVTATGAAIGVYAYKLQGSLSFNGLSVTTAAGDGVLLDAGSAAFTFADLDVETTGGGTAFHQTGDTTTTNFLGSNNNPVPFAHGQAKNLIPYRAANEINFHDSCLNKRSGPVYLVA